MARAVKVVTEKKMIETAVGTVLYTMLVLVTISVTNFFNPSGAEENSYTVKDITSARILKKDLFSNIGGQSVSLWH